jgi:hypothetical protein
MTKEEIQAARLERKRRRAEVRTRADFWLEKKGTGAFGVTLSYKEVRAKAYRSLAEGDTETAVLLNELLKVRRRMEKAGPLLKAVRRLEGAQVRFEAAVANACRVKLSPKVKGELRKERRQKLQERAQKAQAAE